MLDANDASEAREREAVAAEVAARLRDRGLQITETEDPEHLALVLEAVERFETAVTARGGDLMMDDLKSSQPEDPLFVLPRREPDESLPSYTLRVDDAAQRLRDATIGTD
jgi:hypothetical protein